MKKIAILTSGGDAPGMNNAVRTIVKHAQAKGIEAFLVFEGYKGLTNGNIKPAIDFNVDDYISQGGTFIYSARYPEFKNESVRKKAKAQLDKLGIEALVVIGGDGSYHGAQLLHELGLKTMALPGTIDNDITSSDFTIGYDTALNTIVDSISKIRDTMESHNRAAIVEVMGHGCGDLALFSALATGAEIVVTNENKMTAKEIGAIVKEVSKKKRSIIVIVSEHIFKDLDALAKEVEKISGKVTRGICLAHTQRGGVPTAFERINASLMAMHAVDLLAEDKSGLAIGILDGQVKATPILKALALPRTNRKEMAKAINKLNQA
ncbi:MAG: 6-phosphofructokinase [Tenericutes bacterium]|nr:MAG: 6-phosphofructokinase [Mycoplasmatota bacterium]